MNVTEALATRMSCRAFLPTPVPEATVRTILDAARQAPSGGNLQPWRVHALTGAPLAELVATVRARMPTHPRGEEPEYDIYPRELVGPYKDRRFQVGMALHAALAGAAERPRVVRPRGTAARASLTRAAHA